MRITELLDKRSIRIDGAPKSKNEALDQMVELMAKSGKINDLEAYRRKYTAVKRKERQVSERGLRSLTEKVHL